jgi:hypothetical protein
MHKRETSIMRENKTIGWIAVTLFATALAMMLALFVVPALGWDRYVEQYIPINVDGVLLTISLVALIAGILGSFAFKTIQGKVASIGGLLLAVAAAVLFAVTVVPG